MTEPMSYREWKLSEAAAHRLNGMRIAEENRIHDAQERQYGIYSPTAHDANPVQDWLGD